MNTIVRLSFTACLLAILSLRCFGAGPPAPQTYYISSSTGSDSYDGQSPDRPWQHLWMVSLAAISKNPFQPGDSVLLKRGDVWYGQIRLQANGTAERPITIGSYGDGPKPLIYGSDDQIHWEAVAGHKGIFSAIVGKGTTIGNVYQAGKAIKQVNPIGALTYPEDVEAFLASLSPGTVGPVSWDRVWAHTFDDQPANGLLRLFRVAGIMIFNSSYVQVENLDIQRFYTGIDVTNSHNIVIAHNDIRDVLGIGIYLRSGDSNCRVESNTVFHAGNTALYVLNGSDNVFRDNWVSHVDDAVLGIRVGGDKMGIGLQESQRSLAEYNYFAHSGGIDFYFEQGSTVRYNYLYRVRSSGAPHGVNLQVYGNIYNLGADRDAPGSKGVNAVATGPGFIEVFNNTIADASVFSLMGSSQHGGQVVFSDNIVFSSDGGLMTQFGPNVTSDHNCYFSPRPVTFRGNGSTFSSLHDYQQQTGNDRDSIFGDPEFSGRTRLTPLDFKISPNSPCNSKTTVARLMPVTADKAYDHGNETSGNATMGAMQPGKNIAVKPDSCTVNCLGRSFTVSKATYLVRLKIASAASALLTSEFVINGRRIMVDPEDLKTNASDGKVELDVLVRPDNGAIRIDGDKSTPATSVDGIEILPFDVAHGDGPLILAW